MFIREVILVVSNLKNSIEFYSVIFGDALNKSRSRAEFRSGLVLCTEKYWRNKIGLSDDSIYDFSLSSTVVFECDEFFQTIVNILEHGYIQHIINVDSDSVTVVDDDFNVLIIRTSGKDQAVIDNIHVAEILESAMSVRS